MMSRSVRKLIVDILIGSFHVVLAMLVIQAMVGSRIVIQHVIIGTISLAIIFAWAYILAKGADDE